MKRQIKETTITGKRGPQRVITYGYDTKIKGLDVVRVVRLDGFDGAGQRFTPMHRKSGLSVSVYFPTATKALKFANKYLTGFDFTQDKDSLLSDRKLCNCIIEAKTLEGL